jgi:hypothetical protein
LLPEDSKNVRDVNIVQVFQALLETCIVRLKSSIRGMK